MTSLCQFYRHFYKKINLNLILSKEVTKEVTLRDFAAKL
jgi:hypothetical protein